MEVARWKVPLIIYAIVCSLWIATALRTTIIEFKYIALLVYDLIPLLGVLELCKVEGCSLLRLSNGYALFGDESSIASAVPSASISPQPSQSQLKALVNVSSPYSQILKFKGSKILKVRLKIANSILYELIEQKLCPSPCYELFRNVY